MAKDTPREHSAAGDIRLRPASDIVPKGGERTRAYYLGVLIDLQTGCPQDPPPLPAALVPNDGSSTETRT